MNARHEFVNENQVLNFIVVPNEGPILDIPQRFEQLFQKKLTTKASNLKEFFRRFLVLIKYKDVVAEPSSLIEGPQEDMQLEKRVNHIGKILKTGCEIRMTVEIGDYDMDYIILDFGSDVNILTR